jgi:hypothetical protein
MLGCFPAPAHQGSGPALAEAACLRSAACLAPGTHQPLLPEAAAGLPPLSAAQRAGDWAGAHRRLRPHNGPPCGVRCGSRPASDLLRRVHGRFICVQGREPRHSAGCSKHATLALVCKKQRRPYLALSMQTHLYSKSFGRMARRR